MGRNFTAVLAAQLFTQGLAFVVSIVLARRLGPEVYGIYAFGFAFPTWFILIVSLGIDAVVAIDVAADRSKASVYLTAVSALRVPLSIGAIAALWITLRLLVSDPFVQTVTLILGSASILAAYVGTFTSIFRAFERLEFTAFVTAIERSVTTVAILTLIALGFGLIEVSLAYFLGVVAHAAVSLVYLRKRFTRFAPRVDVAAIRSILRKAVPFALTILVGAWLYGTGPVLLTLWRGPADTGVFNAAFVLMLVPISLLALYPSAILPTLSRLYSEQKEFIPFVIQKTQKLFFLLGLPAALGGSFYAAQIVTLLYGERFRGSAESLSVLVFVLAVTTSVLGIGASFAASGRQTLNLKIGFIEALTNVALCVLLIPPYGPIGAALAFLAASVCRAVIIAAAGMRVIGGLHFGEPLARPLLAGLAMVLVLSLLSLPIAPGIAVGAAVYFGVLVALRGITGEDYAILRAAVRGALGGSR